MIVVLNAGTHPEPMHLAHELASRGHEVQYFTSSSLARDHLAARIARARPLSGTPVGRDIGRRVMPVLERSAVRHVAVGSELLYQVAVRARPSMGARLLEARTRRFRAATAARLRARGGDLDAIVAQYTSGLAAFEAAGPSTLRVLSYPIAHHRWMRDRLREESIVNPRWAPFLQGHANAAEFDRMLDAEIALADVVLVPSTFVQETFQYAGIEAAVHPVTLGVDRRVLDAPMTDAGTAGAPLRVLFVGQINQRKGIGYLLDGFRAAGLPGATLTMIGSHSDEVARQVRSYPDVEILPTMSRERLAVEYARADVLALPSLAEGLSLVIIEAMSRGTPALVTHRTGAGDVITDGADGMIVPDSDAGAITEALRRVDGDRALLARMSESARTTASRFDWSRYGATAADVLERALRDRRTGAEQGLLG